MAETSVELADVLELLRWLAAGLGQRGLLLRVDDAAGNSLLDYRSLPVAHEKTLRLADGGALAIALSDYSEGRVREHDAREDERRKLANQVHDSIAQTLTSL